MRLATVVEFLDDTLHLADFKKDSSLNGLQVEASKRISKVALAVDACERSIRRAAQRGADLLIVHHGLFWGDPQPLTGFLAVRVRLLLERGVSLYACHLPLDCHPVVGNNAQLAMLLGLAGNSPFGTYHGMTIGIHGSLPRPVSAAGLATKLRRALGAPVQTFPFGRAKIRTLGICSGGGAFLVQDAAATGCDGLLTGEPSHTSYHPALEAGINLICAGHYATETLGVQALGKLITEELGLPARFIDIPTGL